MIKLFFPHGDDDLGGFFFHLALPRNLGILHVHVEVSWVPMIYPERKPRCDESRWIQVENHRKSRNMWEIDQQN